MAFTSAGRNDVLCGKGAHGTHHSGNKVFRDMVKAWKPRYERASDAKTSSGKETKIEVSQALVRQVNDEGGHFVRKDEGGYYVEISFWEAVNKTSQRFGDTPKKGLAPTNIQPVEALSLGESKADDERKHSPMPTTTTITSVETTSEEDVCNAFADSTRVVDDLPPYSNDHCEIVANSTAFDVFTEPVYAEACLDASVGESAEHSPMGFNQMGCMEAVAIATQVSTGDGYNGMGSDNGMGSEEGFDLDNEFYEFWRDPECVEDEMVVLASEVPQDDSATNTAPGLLQDSENGFTSKKRKFGQAKHEEDVSTGDHADPSNDGKKQQQQQQPNKATRTYWNSIATQIAQESANGIYNRETFEWGNHDAGVLYSATTTSSSTSTSSSNSGPKHDWTDHSCTNTC